MSCLPSFFNISLSFFPSFLPSFLPSSLPYFFPSRYNVTDSAAAGIRGSAFSEESFKTRPIVKTEAVREEDFKVDIRQIIKGEKIGGGGFSTVHKGTYQGRQCAIKIVRFQMDDCLLSSASEAELKAYNMFQMHIAREATILARLHHPNLVEFWGFAIDPNHRCWFLLELCPRTLTSALQKIHKGQNHISGELFLDYANQILNALGFLHARGVIHRDLKPSNILVSHDGGLKLCDFGLSRTFQEQGHTQMTCAVGTPEFMAPEVFSSRAVKGKQDSRANKKHDPSRVDSYDGAIDVYSFSIICWQMWSGEQPYREFDRAFDILHAVMQGSRPSLDSPPFPRELAAIIFKCWEARPEHRPSVEQVQLMLKDDRCQAAIQLFHCEGASVAEPIPGQHHGHHHQASSGASAVEGKSAASRPTAAHRSLRSPSPPACLPLSSIPLHSFLPFLPPFLSPLPTLPHLPLWTFLLLFYHHRHLLHHP
jgi:serine/threonine protein kinase